LVAFDAVVAAFYQIMTPKTFPAKAAFVLANPKSKLMDQLREVLRFSSVHENCSKLFYLACRELFRQESGVIIEPAKTTFLRRAGWLSVFLTRGFRCLSKI
jgi:hypothetical protein